ncbi:MAG TPA: hypothetical protein VFW83_00150 [Bryobacteraceae bacterium]|nr:hypothetical protein [Bryobacteraceae bacterium]
MTVFRSADSSAREDAARVQEMLDGKGIPSSVLDDHAPGVPSGAWEVRVSAEDAPLADQLVAHFEPEDEFAKVDASRDLDLVTVFRTGGPTSEIEAMSIHSLLESSGISVFMVGDARFPNLGYEVRIPKEREEEAKRLIEEALEAGPAGADEAESSSEKS